MGICGCRLPEGKSRSADWNAGCKGKVLLIMDPHKMTVMSRSAVQEAQNEARRRSHNEVDTWHLLVALLGQEGGIIPSLVEKLGLTVSAMQLAANRELDRLPKVSGSVDVSKIY